MIIYLYLKTHRLTKKKYLGKTVQDPYTYPGSGTYWQEHLHRFGNDVDTEILFETKCKDALKEKALYYSQLWQVDENPQFANTVLEAGDGGDTSSSPGYQKYLNEILRNPDSEFVQKTRKRMRENNPMHNPESVAKAHAPEHRSKRAASLRGKPKTEEHKKKLRERNLQPHVRKQLSDRIKGDKNPAKRAEVQAKKKATIEKVIEMPTDEFEKWLSEYKLHDSLGRPNSRIVSILQARGEVEKYYNDK